MLRKLSIITLFIALLAPAFAADQSDQVFAALAAKNDKEVARLLQNLALARDFSQLDKVQAKNPDLFGVKYFPGDFVNKVIFNYVENAAANAKAAQKASGTANPNPKNTWQWYIWDLDKAQANKAASKDPATKKSLQTQIENDIALLTKNLDRLDAEGQVSVGLYLYALNMQSLLGAFTGGLVDPEASLAERMNSKFSDEASAILNYLFKAGIPFPAQLPVSLRLEAWKREKAAFDSFVKITAPDKQGEFETKDEFTARNAEWKRLEDLVGSTEIVLPAQLALGNFNVEEGYFSLSVSLPVLDITDQYGNQAQLIKVRDLAKADIRYYLDRKNAAFFKDKGFAAWAATATIAAHSPGIYGLKEISVKNGKDAVTEGLWGFAVRSTRGNDGENVAMVDNYVKGREYNFSGTKVIGAGVSIPIVVDGTYSLVSAGDSPGQLWKGELTKRYHFISEIMVESGNFSFPLRDPQGRQKAEIPVTLSSFYMARTKITQDTYESLMGANPSQVPSSDSPVTNVSWSDAVLFCNKLSEYEGLSPVYSVDGDNGVSANWDANGYRLPTWAEWTFVVIGGSKATDTHILKANPTAEMELGINDLFGNVKEWCWDSFVADGWRVMFGWHGEATMSDPRGFFDDSKTAAPFYYHVVLGLEWGAETKNTRKAFLGFRVVRHP